MKRGEILRKLIEKIGQDDTEKIIGFAVTHSLLMIIEDGIEEVGNENINKKFKELLKEVETERKKFQEEEIK